jgi:hypothetical protein
MPSNGKTLLHLFLKKPPRSPDNLQEKKHESLYKLEDKRICKRLYKEKRVYLILNDPIQVVSGGVVVMPIYPREVVK